MYMYNLVDMACILSAGALFEICEKAPFSGFLGPKTGFISLRPQPILGYSSPLRSAKKTALETFNNLPPPNFWNEIQFLATFLIGCPWTM